MKQGKPKRQPNTWPVVWHAKLLDPGDGSGDQLIELPDCLLDQMGWKVGDMLEVHTHAAGEFVIRRAVNTKAEVAIKKSQKPMTDTELVTGVETKKLIKNGRK